MTVGDRVEENIQTGDLVCALGLSIGGNAKYAIVPSSRVFMCPEDIHPSIAACLLRNYMAAYQCLHRAGGVKVRPGHRVLILGGAGAFGQACIQLAIAAGADEIYATGGSDKSQIIIESLGAQSLGRSPREWLSTVQGKMDIVIDSVCSDRFRSSHRALNSRGKLICVGSTSVLLGSGGASVFSGVPLSVKMDMAKATSLMTNTYVYDVFSYFESKRDLYRKDLLRLFHLCRNHEISPKVAYCVTLDEVANAHDNLVMGEVADGTIVCLPFGPYPSTKKVNQTTEDDGAIITLFSDGVRLRLSTDAEPLETKVGRVMRDGSFEVRKVRPAPDRSTIVRSDTRDDTEEEGDSMSERRGARNTKSVGRGRSSSNLHRDTDSVGDGSISYHRKNNSRMPKRSVSKRVHPNEVSDEETASFNGGHRRNRRESRTDVSTVGDEQTEDLSSRRPETAETNLTERDGRSVMTYDETEGEDSDPNDKRPRRRIKYDDMGSYADDSYAPPPRNSKRSAPRIPKGDNTRAPHNDKNRSRRTSRDRREFDGEGDYGHDRRQQNGQGRGYDQRPKPSVRSASRDHARGNSFRDGGSDYDRGRGHSRNVHSSRDPRARSRSRGRGEHQPHVRSQSRGPQQPRARSRSRGREQNERPRSVSRESRARSRSRSHSRGPTKGRSRSKSRARSRSRGPEIVRGRSRSLDSVKSRGALKGKGLFSRFKNRGRSLSVTRDKVKSSLKKSNTRGSSTARRSSSRGPTPRFREKQQKRESQRRDMMYVDQDPEESSLFPEIEAVRSIVMLKGEEDQDEIADEQSFVSWDGTEREERRSRRGSSRGPSRSRQNTHSSRDHNQRSRPHTQGDNRVRNSRSHSRRRY